MVQIISGIDFKMMKISQTIALVMRLKCHFWLWVTPQPHTWKNADEFPLGYPREQRGTSRAQGRGEEGGALDHVSPLSGISFPPPLLVSQLPYPHPHSPAQDPQTLCCHHHPDLPLAIQTSPIYMGLLLIKPVLLPLGPLQKPQGCAPTWPLPMERP